MLEVFPSRSGLGLGFLLRRSGGSFPPLALLIAIFALASSLWSLSAAVQTNPPPATNSPVLSTNSPPPAASETNSAAHSFLQRVHLTFGLDRIVLLQRSAMGIPLWQYLASAIYIALALFASNLLDLIIGAQLRRWTARYRGAIWDPVLRLLDAPIKIVIFVILLHIGLELFEWPDVLVRWFSRGLTVLVAVSITYMAVRLVDCMILYWRQRMAQRADRSFQEHLLPLISKALKVFVLVVSILLTCQNLEIHITSLLASLSIGGLALGLAAQDTLANLFGAISIFADQPFRIGDRIQVDSLEGAVESIGLRSTRIRNADGYLITVPNKTMGNATITNITRRPTIRTVLNFGITYDTPSERIERAYQLLEQIYKAHPMTGDVWISFNKFADSALNIQVIHWWKNTDYKAYLQGMQELNLSIKKRFDEEALNFAFPTQTLYVKQDSDWRVKEGEPAHPNGQTARPL